MHFGTPLSPHTQLGATAGRGRSVPDRVDYDPPVQRDLVLRGLGENPAVPVDALVRLLHGWPEPVTAGLQTRTELPVALQEHMADHESRRVRCAVAGYQRVDPEIRDRLLSDA